MMDTFLLMAATGFGLGELFEWVKQQGEYAVWIIMIVLLAIVASKRAWSMLVTLVLCGGVVLFFVNNPSAIGGIGEALANLFGIQA